MICNGGEIDVKIISVNIENIHFESEKIVAVYDRLSIDRPTGRVMITYNIETSIGKIEKEIQMREDEYETLNLQQLKDYILESLGVKAEVVEVGNQITIDGEKLAKAVYPHITEMQRKEEKRKSYYDAFKMV
jgi:hypothetical protein